MAFQQQASLPEAGRKAHLRVRTFSEAEWWLLAKASGFQAAGLARRCGIGLRQLERVFQADFGVGPKEWLTRRRMRTAQELLREGWRAQEVAAELGFKQASHFCRVFKETFGESFTEYATRRLDDPPPAAGGVPADGRSAAEANPSPRTPIGRPGQFRADVGKREHLAGRGV